MNFFDGLADIMKTEEKSFIIHAGLRRGGFFFESLVDIFFGLSSCHLGLFKGIGRLLVNILVYLSFST